MAKKPPRCPWCGHSRGKQPYTTNPYDGSELAEPICRDCYEQGIRRSSRLDFTDTISLSKHHENITRDRRWQ